MEGQERKKERKKNHNLNQDFEQNQSNHNHYKKNHPLHTQQSHELDCLVLQAQLQKKK